MQPDQTPDLTIPAPDFTTPIEGTPIIDPAAEQFADDAFSADGVDDFGSAGEFTGTLPGEQAPSTGAPASNIDALLEGVDMSDPLDAFTIGVKVKFAGTVLGVKEWSGTGRVALIVDIMPTSPPQCVALGRQSEFCDIVGKGAAEGLAKLRALAKSAKTPPDKPSMLVGKEIAASMSKSKKGNKMFLNF